MSERYNNMSVDRLVSVYYSTMAQVRQLKDLLQVCQSPEQEIIVKAQIEKTKKFLSKTAHDIISRSFPRT